MASEDRDKPAPINFSGLLTVLVLAAGAIWVNLPLEALRPPPSAAGIPLTRIQDVDARLWQDPFGAVAKARQERASQRQLEARGSAERKKDKADDQGDKADGKSLRSGGRKGYSHRPRTLQAVITQELSDATGEATQSLNVLGVMVYGDATVGADEYRRRTRYAVLSALMSASYKPDDPEHIGYVRTTPAQGRPQIVPYEWFRAGRRLLLVLWLDENALMQTPTGRAERGPLARLSNLMEDILGPHRKHARLDFVGPAGTDMLLEMGAELAELHDRCTAASGGLSTMAFFSPFATISDEVVTKDFLTRLKRSSSPTAAKVYKECANPEASCNVEKLFATGGLRGFIRMNSSDAEVVAAVFDELRQRRIGPDSEIAVVGEWDTRYALQLRDEISAAHRKGLSRMPPATRSDAPEGVHRFGYMRGLDGRVSETDKKDAKKSDDKPRERLQVERPEGDAQVDYLRRLAGLMKEREQQLSRESARKVQFRAIGVVGNDYYDKLLVLQALRPVFPDALFFTTDLYAAMLHPTDNAFTRNLIVGSAFGLTLHHRLQNGTPPFRDSYQTAAFLATRVALAADAASALYGEYRVERSLRPTVWEVGRTRFFELRPQAGKRECFGPLHCDHVHDLGERRTGLEWRDVAWPMLAGIVVLLVFFPSIVHWVQRSFRERWFHSVLVPALLVVPLVLALPVFIDAGNPHGEPFAWFEGVSVWPSNLIRLVALAVALAGLTYVFQTVRDRMLECDRQFFRPGAAVTPTPAAPAGGLLVRWGKRLVARVRLEWTLFRDRVRAFWADDSTRGITAEAAWEEYKRSMGRRTIGVAAFLELLCLWVFASLILALSGAELTSPARSRESFLFNNVVVVAAVIVTQYLLVCVALVLRKTSRLGRKLDGNAQWPDTIRTERGLPDASRMRQFDEWLNLSLLARQTGAINALVYFPFFALLLIALARFRIFDNWTTPISLTVVMALSFLYLLMAAFRVRRTAEEARSAALASLQDKLIFLQGSAQAEAVPLAAQCRALMDHVRALDRGAFMPIGQQPVVRAFLGLVGGLSGAALLEYAALANF